jgi:O-antigen/teichoic acid export membrane protein
MIGEAAPMNAHQTNRAMIRTFDKTREDPGQAFRADSAQQPTQRLHRVITAFVSRVAATSSILGLHLLLARVLGSEGYGEYVFVTMWVTLLATVAMLGMENASLRFVAQYNARGMTPQLTAFLRSSRRWVVTSSSCGAVLLTVCIWLLPFGISPRLRDCFLCGAVLLPLQAMLRTRESALRALGKTGISMTSIWFVPCMTALVVILGRASELSQITSVHVLAIQTAFTGIVLVRAQVALSRNTPSSQPIQLGAADQRMWLSVSFPLMLLAVATVVQNQGSVLLAGAFLGVADAGILGAAIKLSSVFLFGIDAVNYVVAPSFAASHAEGNRAQLQSEARFSAMVSTAYVGMTSVVLITFGRQLLSLFGDGFDSGYIAFVILAAGAIVNAVSGSTTYLLTMTGHHTTCLKVFVLNALAHIGIACLLIPPLGVNGAAIATALSVATWNISLAYFVRRRLGIWSFAAPEFLERIENKRSTQRVTSPTAVLKRKDAA